MISYYLQLHLYTVYSNVCVLCKMKWRGLLNFVYLGVATVNVMLSVLNFMSLFFMSLYH